MSLSSACGIPDCKYEATWNCGGSKLSSQQCERTLTELLSDSLGTREKGDKRGTHFGLGEITSPVVHARSGQLQLA